MPRRKTLKLSSPADIRRSIARVSNMILNDEVDPKQGNALLYACNSALNAIKTCEMQAKLNELEAILMEVER